MSQAASRVQLMMGITTAGAGLALALVITLHPENLRTPGWVAYLACLAFGAGGAAAIARSYGRDRLANAFVCLLLATFAITGYWIAFAQGPRACHVRTAGISSAGGAAACRTAFGVGAAIVTVMFLVAVRAFFRTQPKG